MTISAFDDYEAEDYDSESEDYDSEAEDYDSEDARSDRARRRQAALRVARQRRTRSQPRPRRAATAPSRVAPTARQTVAAIRNLDLENKVGEDSLRQSIERANTRARRATYAAVASVALDQALDTFGDDLKDHDFVRAALRLGPLLLLTPQHTRRGLEGYLLDPRVLGGAAIAGVVAVGAFRNRDTDVANIEFSPPALTAIGQQGRFAAFAVDSKGRDVSTPIKWASDNAAVLSLSEQGDFVVQAVGVVRVTAEAGNFRKSFFLTVTTDCKEHVVEPGAAPADGGGAAPAGGGAAPAGAGGGRRGTAPGGK